MRIGKYIIGEWEFVSFPNKQITFWIKRVEVPYELCSYKTCESITISKRQDDNGVIITLPPFLDELYYRMYLIKLESNSFDESEILKNKIDIFLNKLIKLKSFI